MIKRSFFNKLIQSQDIEILEHHILYSYLKNNSLDFSKSILLNQYFKDYKLKPDLIQLIDSLKIANIKELENYFELLIPIEDRKVNGAFFTPDYIVDFIIEEINPLNEDTNLDPSCGCGAFLIGLIDYYKKKFNKPIKDIVRENIFAADILEYNVIRAKLILTTYALQNGEVLSESDFNLSVKDSLRYLWNEKFNNIIGNPPYVKFQDLQDDNRLFLINNLETIKNGSYNLYFAFFELGFNLLKGNGNLGFITPNNYFTSLSAEPLRSFLNRKKCIVKIIDFSHKKVFDAQAYTAITIIKKKELDYIYFDRIEENQTPKSFLTNLSFSSNYVNKLNNKKWRLLKSDELKNIESIETVGQPIGKLFDINVGIATLKDELFFINGNQKQNNYYVKNTNKGRFLIESEVVQNVYKISDFSSQEEIINNNRKIICPYFINNNSAKIIQEIDFKIKFPKCYEYFLSIKEELLLRDKGKVEYKPFYAWGRTQGLTKKGKKIINPTFSKHPRFLLIDDENAFFTNGYGLFFKNNQNEEIFDDSENPITNIKNIDVIQKILNSYVMDYYVKKTSVSIEGGYPCYQKNFIERFTIPQLSEIEIERLRRYKKPNEINTFLIDKYQINVTLGNRFE